MKVGNSFFLVHTLGHIKAFLSVCIDLAIEILSLQAIIKDNVQKEGWAQGSEHTRLCINSLPIWLKSILYY